MLLSNPPGIGPVPVWSGEVPPHIGQTIAERHDWAHLSTTDDLAEFAQGGAAVQTCPLTGLQAVYDGQQ